MTQNQKQTLLAILDFMQATDPNGNYAEYITAETPTNDTLQTIDDILTAWRKAEYNRNHREQARKISRIRAKLILLYD